MRSKGEPLTCRSTRPAARFAGQHPRTSTSEAAADESHDLADISNAPSASCHYANGSVLHISCLALPTLTRLSPESQLPVKANFQLRFDSQLQFEVFSHHSVDKFVKCRLVVRDVVDRVVFAW